MIRSSITSTKHSQRSRYSAREVPGAVLCLTFRSQLTLFAMWFDMESNKDLHCGRSGSRLEALGVLESPENRRLALKKASSRSEF
jgi:hypothetical protein